MFFYLSKILWFFVQPSSLLVLMVLIGALLLFTRRAKWGRRLVLTGAILLLVCGLSPLAHWLTLPLEQRFPRPKAEDLASPPAGIIVLGGGTDTMVTRARGVVTLNEAGERLTEGLALAHRFPDAKLVMTGGTAEIFYDRSVEADVANAFFTSMGLDPKRILLQAKSRNTYEDALYTKQLVNPQPGELWLLVTSARHMPRAVGCFRRVGFTVTAWPGDFRTRGPEDLTRFFDKPSAGLRRLDTVTREYLGLFVYWLTDRTSAFLPGP